MISDYRCFFCFAREFDKLLGKETIPNEVKNSFTLDMIRLYQGRWKDFSAPQFSRDLHNLLKGYTNNIDPYHNEKRLNNDQALAMLPELKELISKSEDPFMTALRLAIAGNIMDFAARNDFNLNSTIDNSLSAPFAIDHSERLREEITKAQSVLYIGDNAGEIVFDRLFIETIQHPDLTYVVRGAPVINDATMEDAEYVGLKNLVKVISNGYDAPSTIIQKAGKSFQRHFEKSDLIISKGQGNLEGLIPLKDDRIFFLLMVKCDVISEFLEVKRGSFVVYNGRNQ